MLFYPKIGKTSGNFELSSRLFGSLCFNHLLSTADAELELVPFADVYFGNAKELLALVFIFLAAHKDAPNKGISLCFFLFLRFSMDGASGQMRPHSSLISSM